MDDIMVKADDDDSFPYCGNASMLYLIKIKVKGNLNHHAININRIYIS